MNPPAPPRSVWQWIYGAAHRLRRRWYTDRAERLPAPVVSIGNLHWGGTGKTPLTAAVTRGLLERGFRPAILSRGYGSRGRGVRLVSSGEGPLLGPGVAGDEPVQLAGELPGAAVVVCADRHRAGRHAMERLHPPPDVFVLDDGFQHLRLARDIDLVVLPGADPFGKGRLAPSGRLREPLVALRHADAIVVSESTPNEAREIARALAGTGFEGPAFSSRIESRPARWSSGETVAPTARMLLVSGIGRPGRFEEEAERAGIQILGHLKFRDHHSYPDESLERIARAADELRADGVLATSKDAVKLLGRLQPRLAELPVRAILEGPFWNWFDEVRTDWIADASGLNGTE